MRHVILGARYSGVLDKALRDRGLEPIYMPDNPNIDERLAGHADLSVFKLSDKKLILAPHLKDSELAVKLEELGIECSYSSIIQEPKYPKDTQLNACRVGNFLFCAQGITDESLINAASGCNVIWVKQGYCRCSICAVGDSAIISADQGIISAAILHGIECLQIKPGFVELEGFPYGFIGGASFAGDGEQIYFTGLLDKHPDKEIVLEFLETNGIRPVFLTNNSIFDVGTCIII